MLQLTLLNSIAPKLRFEKTEGLSAKIRNWFSDGYRVSVPGTATCRSTSECEKDEICQSGYCTGLGHRYSTFGEYYGDEHSAIIQQYNSTSFQPISNGYNIDYISHLTKSFQPDPDNLYTHNYEHDYDYE